MVLQLSTNVLAMEELGRKSGIAITDLAPRKFDWQFLHVLVPACQSEASYLAFLSLACTCRMNVAHQGQM
jgi:hypothetical protein